VALQASQSHLENLQELQALYGMVDARLGKEGGKEEGKGPRGRRRAALSSIPSTSLPPPQTPTCPTCSTTWRLCGREWNRCSRSGRPR